MNEQDVLSVFNAIKDALMANDLEKIEALVAEDYRGFNLAGGVDNRSLILEVYKPGAVKLEKVEAQELKVEVMGEVGLVTGTSYLCGHFGGEHFFEHHFRFLDLFVRREGRWLYYLSQATEIAPSPE